MILRDLPAFVALATVFVVLERLAPLHPKQRVLRTGFWTDVSHYVINGFVVVSCLVALLTPAMVLVALAIPQAFRAAVAAQPMWLQVVELTLVSDLGIYVGHRLTHEIPWLWRFHSIHHSAVEVDWLTATRNHPVDLIFTRAWTLLPGYALGFSGRSWGIYAAYFVVQSIFLHANIRLRLGRLSYLYAGPEFHRWHHADTDEARDKNFVSHFPWLDLLFGTLYLPQERRPSVYGTREIVPDGYVKHLAYPFRS